MSERFTSTPALTSRGLPVVTQSTFDAIIQNYTTRESWGEHLEDVKKGLLDENPVLARFVEYQTGKFPPQWHDAIFEVVVATIALLDHQAEAHRFAERFSPDDPAS